MKHTIATAIVALALFAATPPAQAVQLDVMLQGYLTNASGTPYTTPQAAEFKVFQGGTAGTAGSGTLVYDETGTISPAPSGVFTYLLGSGSPAGAPLSTTTFDTTQPVYIEITVGGTILLPRLQLTGMPYAAIAGVAESLKPVSLLTTSALIASSGTFTASGAAYSVTTSSGIEVLSGGVTAPFFSGTYYGDGSHLMGVTATQVQAGNVIGGPLASSILPSTVAYTSATNTFTGPQTFGAGLTATNGAFTATGTAYSLITSSGINVAAGGVTAPFVSAPIVSGTFYGDGSHLAGVTATQVQAGNVVGGPLASSILPSTVAYTSASNGFTAPQTFSAGLTATRGAFIATGDAYSLTTSSGINVIGGGLTAPFVSAPSFSGTYYGDGSHLTGVTAMQAPAGSIIDGPLASSILPSTVAYTSASNSFTAPQTFGAGLTATSGAFMATGNIYSVSTSSGINVAAGGVTAPYVSAGSITGTLYGDASHVTGIAGTVPIGAIMPYAGTAEPVGWIECDGRSIPQSGSTSASWGSYNTAALFAAIGTVWGSSSAGQFNIPDLRGIFPRGYNHGKTGVFSDPDAASRVAQYPSGSTGDRIGSYQADQLASHTHNYVHTISNYADGFGGGGATPGSLVNDVTSPTGGSETRPKNAAVLYIIRVQ